MSRGTYCPSCGIPGIGNIAVKVRTRGTDIQVDSCICGDCGTIYVPEREMKLAKESLSRLSDDSQLTLEKFI